MWLRTPKASIVTLDSNLGFVSDMRVILYNTEDSYFGGTNSTVIGQFLVPITSITTLYNYPQYFNFVDEQGNLTGRVLARFYIVQKSQSVDEKKEREIRKQINEILLKRSKFDLTVAIIGLRSLVTSLELKDFYGKAKKYQVRINLTNHAASVQNSQEQYPRPSFIERNKTNQETEGDQSEKFPQIIKAFGADFTNDPNFGEILRFRGLEFAEEPLLWPWLQIDVLEASNPGIVISRSLIPLFTCAKQIFEADGRLRQIKFTMALLKTLGNPTNESVFRVDQPQLNPAMIYYSAMRERQLIGHQQKDFYPEISIDEELVELEEEASEGSRVIEKNLQEDLGEMRKSIDDQERQKRNVKNINQLSQIQIGYFSESDEEEGRVTLNEQKLEEQQRLLQQSTAMFSEADDPYEIQHHLKSYDIEVTCSEDDKRLELERIKLEKQKSKKLLKQLKLVYETVSKKRIQGLKEAIRNQEMQIRRQLEEMVQNCNITEEKFIGLQCEQQVKQFEVGDRVVLKQGTREDMLAVPFQNYPLLSFQTGWHTSAQAYDFVDQVFRTGRLNGSFVRAKVLLERNTGELEDGSPRVGESDSEEEVDLEFQVSEELMQDCSLEAVMAWVKSRDYLFDVLDKKFIDTITSIEKQEFKVRVYIISCQNLTAVDSFVEWNNRLAGDSALSSANPYPVIKVGQGSTANNQAQVKFIDEKDKPVLRDLNPQFFRVYELDAQFPDDWRLEIEIRDKRYLPSNVDFGLFDTLIGKTVIDLEQRWFGNQYNQMRFVLQIRQSDLEQKKKIKLDQLKRAQKGSLKYKKIDQQFLKISAELEQLKIAQKVVKESDPPFEPVEFRELMHPDKKQAQGVIQMWCEVLTLEDSRNQPMIKFEQEKKEENYEVRLIIWETREIPLSDGESVDIFVKAIFCAESLNDNTVEKQTDVHNASSDGRGIFNYRMKFSLHMPADFPRIKLQVYDKNALSGDMCLGECILNIRNTVMLFQKHGKVDLKKVWASFTNPQKSDETTGYALISVQLLTQSEADQSPVGDAQEDPNEDPKLVRPVEGRGYGAVLQGMGFKMPKITLPTFDMFRKIMILVIVIVVLGFIAFLLMYFKK